MFVDSINVFDCLLSGVIVRVKYHLSYPDEDEFIHLDNVYYKFVSGIVIQAEVIKVIKLFFMLNSPEHKIYHAHKY